MDKIDYLNRYLLKEIGKEYNPLISNDEKEIVFRSLCNIRKPEPISDEFLKVQDEYLKEVAIKRGIKKITEENKIYDNIYLWQGDITCLKVEAIVNAANSVGLGCFIPCHICIDNSIHFFSGIQLRLECKEKMDKIGILQTGKCFITKAYNLPSSYVIHTVGPIINNIVTKEDEEKLKACYINSLKIAKENRIKTIAFPCISTGEFRFPQDKACKVAVLAVKEFFEKEECDIKVIFNVYKDYDLELYTKELKNYVK